MDQQKAVSRVSREQQKTKQHRQTDRQKKKRKKKKKKTKKQLTSLHQKVSYEHFQLIQSMDFLNTTIPSPTILAEYDVSR